MPIDRNKFLRAALWLGLTAAPLAAAGCGGSQPEDETVMPADETGGDEISSVDETAVGPADETAPADEAGADDSTIVE